MPITVGQPAPDFELENQDKKKIKLSDLKGKKIVLAFYPLDFSPVCTNEHVCFMTDLPQFNAKDATIRITGVEKGKALGNSAGGSTIDPP